MSDVIFEPINVEAPPGLDGLEESAPPPPPPIEEPARAIEATEATESEGPMKASEPAQAAVPAPKKRGRPKGSPNKPKPQTKATAATEPSRPSRASTPIESKASESERATATTVEKTIKSPKKRKPGAKMESEEDSSEEEREVYRKLTSDDLETNILSFLVNRRTEQQTKRRDLWTNLARSGLK